jgi:heat shock protein HtpX
MFMRAAGLQTYIWNNNLRSILLLVFYPALLCGMAWLIAASIGVFGGYHGNPDYALRVGVNMGNRMIAQYWPTIVTIVAVWFLIAWQFNTRMVRMLSHSRPVTREEQPLLYNLVENLCISRGMKTPRLEIIDTQALNAFASGIDERSFSITVTSGLLAALDKDELEAVLAHELTHIINRDVRLLIVSIIFVGMVGFAAQLFWNMVRRGMYSARRYRSRDSKGSGAALLMVLAVGVILWLGYLATLFTRFALSRRREYMADAGAVELTKNPAGMVGALQRIAGHDRIPQVTGDVALMCTQNSQKFLGLFSTHPPIGDRINAISELTQTPVPEIAPPIAAEPPQLPEDAQESLPNNPWRRNPWRRG